MYSLIKENIVKLTISKYETKCVLMTTLLLELSGIHVVIVCKTHHAVGPAAVQRGCDFNLRGQIKRGHSEHHLNTIGLQ